MPDLSTRAIVGSAIRDAFGVMRLYQRAVLIVAAIGIAITLLSWNRLPRDQHFDAINLGANIFTLIIVYFAIAASVRTIKPGFRFDVATWFGNFGWAIVSGLLTAAAALALLIPAFWIGPKLSLTPYVYLLSLGNNDEAPLACSWRITTGHYWETIGLNLLVLVVILPAIFLVALVAAALAFVPLAGGILATLVLCTVSAWSYQVLYLALTRWTHALMQRDVYERVALQTV